MHRVHPFFVHKQSEFGKTRATKNWKNRINKKLFLVISRLCVAKETEL
jgi:hypothetical protein